MLALETCRRAVWRTLSASALASLLFTTLQISTRASGEDSAQSGKIAADALPRDSVGLYAQYSSDKTTTEIRIQWSGQDTKSILVVSIKRDEPDDGLQVEVIPDTITLGGIAVFRSAEASGETSLVLNSKSLIDSLGGAPTVVFVRFVKRVDLLIGKADPDIKGGQRIVEVRHLEPRDFGSEFRFLSTANPSAFLSALSKSIQPHRLEVADDAVVQAVIHAMDQTACLTFPVKSLSQ